MECLLIFITLPVETAGRYCFSCCVFHSLFVLNSTEASSSGYFSGFRTWGCQPTLGGPFSSPLPFSTPSPSPLSLLSPWSRGGCCAKVGGINPPPWGECGKLPVEAGDCCLWQWMCWDDAGEACLWQQGSKEAVGWKRPTGRTQRRWNSSTVAIAAEW